MNCTNEENKELLLFKRKVTMYRDVQVPQEVEQRMEQLPSMPGVARMREYINLELLPVLSPLPNPLPEGEGVDN